MKKFICVLMLVVSLSSLLTGCYTCAACGEDKLFGKNEVLGVEICDDCMEAIGSSALY